MAHDTWSIVEDVLGPGGPIAARLGDRFEQRDQQLQMARSVCEVMEAAAAGEKPEPLFVEAGTGVGKSFAYLVPAIVRAVVFGERVVVATHTISLQEQLIDRDIPSLVETIDEWAFPDRQEELRPVLVKGRANYLSVRRLSLASARQERLLAEGAARRSLHVVEDWAYETQDGTLSTLPALERAGVWDHVRSDSGNCMGRRCPTYDRCFYQQARRDMQRGNLLICNHALFFSNLALERADAGFLPAHEHIVLDEAHGVEDVAGTHFGCALAEGRVRRLLSQLVAKRAGKGYLPQLAIDSNGDPLMHKAMRLVSDTQDAADLFFEDAGGLIQDAAGSARLQEPDLIENHLSMTASRLAHALQGLREHAADAADKYELTAYAERAAAIADDAEALVAQSVPGAVYWVERSGGEFAGRSFRLECAPVDVGPILGEHLFSGATSVTLTSATLATGKAQDAFEHVKTRLGAPDAATLQLGSPFPLAELMEVIVDGALPAPGAGSAYEKSLSDRVAYHAGSTEGGAFVLFTSLATMKRVADLCQPTLGELGLDLFVQGRDGPRGQVLDRFLESSAGVLFGAASFWQGVDVRGHALRNVIITRLPFEPPDRPLTSARLERVEAEGGSGFMDDSLPRAVMRFKQGVGRLVRSASDRGRVVILDPRVVRARYGRRFLDVLPPDVPIRMLDPEPTFD